MDSRPSAAVAGVERLQHYQQLWASHLADRDSVGPHTQSLAQQLIQANLTRTFDVRLAGLEGNEVPHIETNLGDIFNGDDPLTPALREHGPQQGGLSRAGATGYQEVFAPLNDLAQQTQFGFIEHTASHQLNQTEMAI